MLKMWNIVLNIIKVLIILYILLLRIKIVRVSVNHVLIPVHNHVPNAENVHDTNVRRELWEKWKIISTEVEENIKKYEPNAIYYAAYKMPDILKTTAAEKIKLKKLVETIEKDAATVLNIEGAQIPEKKVFAYCFYNFRRLKLDPAVMIEQYMSCFDADGSPVCVVGRVSRYIGMFEGLVEGPLGTSEETETLMKQRALNRMKAVLDEFMNNNPEIKRKYEEGADLTEAEISECVLLIKNMFRDEFPKLTNEKINELLTALN